jgi:DNA-binding MarR family transcriptional regulator
MEGAPLRPGELAGALLAASDWFNDALVERLAAQGWPALNRSQSQVFAALAQGPARPATLARRIGITRQSMQVLLHGLAAEGLVAVQDDPDDRRAHVVRLRERGRRLLRDAETVLVGLEDELAGRIGLEQVEALRRALGRSWGPRPATGSAQGNASSAARPRSS